MPWVPQSTRMARKLAHGSFAHELLCANFLAMRVTWNGLNRALENNQLLHAGSDASFFGPIYEKA